MDKDDPKKHGNKSTSATGPRTAAGKERSKLNAVKHGIFSKAVVLPNEPRSEFDSMFRHLRNDLQPNGALEEMLVDRLADLTWRRRRLLIAEGAEIQIGADFLECDKAELASEEARQAYNSDDSCLMDRITNPTVLKRCLELLEELETAIKRNGFDPEVQVDRLSKLYRDSDSVTWTLFNTYNMWCYLADCSDEERKEKRLPSAIECVKNFLAELRRREKSAYSVPRRAGSD